MKRGTEKRGQVWIETVIYTLIAFSIIAAVLAVAKPQIEKMQDKATIEKSIEIMKDIDKLIESAVQSPIGNRQKLEIGIKNGELIIDGINDQVRFELESRYKYSEESTDTSPQLIKVSSTITAETKKAGAKTYKVILTRDCKPNYNIHFDQKNNPTDITKTIGTTETFHNLLVEHKSQEVRETGTFCTSENDCDPNYKSCAIDPCDAKCVSGSCLYYDKNINLDFTLS